MNGGRGGRGGRWEEVVAKGKARIEGRKAEGRGDTKGGSGGWS